MNKPQVYSDLKNRFKHSKYVIASKYRIPVSDVEFVFNDAVLYAFNKWDPNRKTALYNYVCMNLHHRIQLMLRVDFRKSGKFLIGHEDSPCNACTHAHDCNTPKEDCKRVERFVHTNTLRERYLSMYQHGGAPFDQVCDEKLNISVTVNNFIKKYPEFQYFGLELLSLVESKVHNDKLKVTLINRIMQQLSLTRSGAYEYVNRALKKFKRFVKPRRR